MIAAVVPTVAGRHPYLLSAFGALAMEADSVYVLKGYPSCGAAWDRGMQLALADGADYILLGADDLVAVPGWVAVGVSQLEQGVLPGARLLNVDGSVWNPDEVGDVSFSRVPMITAAMARQLLPFPDLHYYSDGLVADWLNRRVVVLPDSGFAFVHHWAKQGRLESDGEDFKRWQQLRQQRPGDAFP